MIAVRKDRRRLVAAAVLAAGIPLLVTGGFALTVAMAVAIESMRSGIRGMGTSSVAWWTAGFVTICVAHWFLVRWCVLVGGWRALFLGLGGCVMVAATAFVLAMFAGSRRPDDSMAGLGWGLLAYVLFFFTLLALVMGAIAHRLESRRVVTSGRPGQWDNGG